MSFKIVNKNNIKKEVLLILTKPIPKFKTSGAFYATLTKPIKYIIKYLKAVY